MLSISNYPLSFAESVSPTNTCKLYDFVLYEFLVIPSKVRHSYMSWFAHNLTLCIGQDNSLIFQILHYTSNRPKYHFYSWGNSPRCSQLHSGYVFKTFSNKFSSQYQATTSNHEYIFCHQELHLWRDFIFPNPFPGSHLKTFHTWKEHLVLSVITLSNEPKNTKIKCQATAFQKKKDVKQLHQLLKLKEDLVLSVRAPFNELKTTKVRCQATPSPP